MATPFSLKDAANDTQAVTRIQQQLDVADDNALLSGMKGLSIKAVVDPTFIYTQRANESDFVLMRDNDRFNFFDSAFGQAMIEFGKPPRAVLDVAVREVYFHCGKALMRSRLWAPESRVARSAQPSISEVIHDQTGMGTPESQDQVEARYRTQL